MHGFINDLNNDYNNLIGAIHSLLIIAGASKQPSNGVRKKPLATWWDDECKDIILQKIKFFISLNNLPHLQAY